MKSQILTGILSGIGLLAPVFIGYLFGVSFGAIQGVFAGITSYVVLAFAGFQLDLFFDKRRMK